MKELSELSVNGQLCLTKRQLGNQEGHVVEVAYPCPTMSIFTSINPCSPKVVFDTFDSN